MQFLLAFFFFFTAALALPRGINPALTNVAARADNAHDTLAAQLLTIAPDTSSCDGAKYPNECRTATQAAGPIHCSFQNYTITNVNEQAAVISLMLYESGEFKYNWGHFVGGADVHTPGKGTRNMQSASYNEQYARTLFSSDAVTQAKASGDDGVLQLVSPDIPSFGSAAWFLTTQCEASVRTALQTGSQDGLEQYVSGCIGGTMDQSRIDYWTKAKAALAS